MVYLINKYQRTLLYDDNGNITISTVAKIEHVAPRVRFWDLLFFLIFTNDLPKFVSDKSVPVLSADDTNSLLCHSNLLTVIALLTLDL
jgi:hypothetical protein